MPFGLDLPFNNMLSHIPYFVSGVLSIIIVTHTDYNLRLQSEAEGNPAAPNLRFFYALSWCLVLEGFGSSCYHLCPTSYQFQFDSAMMFVIATLSTVCLLDGSDSEDRLFTPVVLMLLITVPMWTISFVGTWFDFVVPVSAQGAISYNIYCASVLVWFVFILLKESGPQMQGTHCSRAKLSQERLYQENDLLAWSPLKVQHVFPNLEQSNSWCSGGSKALAVTRTLTWILVAVMLYFPTLRINSGGMSNVLLFLSLLVMVFAIGRQMVKRDRSRRDTLSLDDAVRWLSKFGLLFLFLLTSFVALHFFNTTMTDVLASVSCLQVAQPLSESRWYCSSAQPQSFPAMMSPNVSLQCRH